MSKHRRALVAGLVLSLAAVLLFPGVLTAEEKKEMGGWEKDGPYNKLYKMSEFDQFKATIKEIIEVTPLPGMAPGVGLIITTDDGEEVQVHLGPTWFIRNLKFRPGDKVRIRGAWAEYKGKEFFMAAKIKMRGDESVELKVRLTKDGTPFWTMSATDLVEEKDDF
ncbi:MAG: hypothetical protein V1742_09970 [Pseudomonadota bacterium]